MVAPSLGAFLQKETEPASGVNNPEAQEALPKAQFKWQDPGLTLTRSCKNLTTHEARS